MEKKQIFETNGKYKYEDLTFTFRIEYDDVVAAFSSEKMVSEDKIYFIGDD